MTRHNLNSPCTVTLTAAGAELFRRGWAADGLPPPEVRAGQKVTVPLWELMRAFGPGLGCGGEAPFEGNGVEVGGES